MPCGHARKRSSEDRLDRREFMKAALVIGGLNALTTVRARAATPPAGTADPSSLPDRQFAWDAFVPKNDIGLPKGPSHRLLLHLEYIGDGEPTESERDQIETALRTLERAYDWSNDGLLFTIGYSPTYFDRFDENLPAEVMLQRPETIVDEVDIESSGDIAAEYDDAHMHLASDNVQVLLEAEAALCGELDEINDTSVEADFTGVFETVDRRTGFVGEPFPHENWEDDQ